METIKKLSGVFVICFCFFVLISIQIAQAQEGKIDSTKKIAGNQVIHIGYSSGIVPQKVKIKAGTTVIWINEANTTLFIEFITKQVTMACKSPIHFVVDEDGTFASNRIPMGAVASLCFIEKGEYVYKVRRATPKPTPAPQLQVFTGNIIVE